jgi:GT2 family glycosyltransferase
VLRKTLAKKGWSGKEALYTPLFDSVEYLREADDPDISIIVISWRRHRDTLRNLSLLQRQRCHNFELVFVNNGAEESEFDDLKSNIDTYISLNRNTGAYLARNVGAAFAKAPILLFLEDDGIPEEKFVEAHLSAHRRDEVIAVRGVYLPKTGKPLNSLAFHYFLGPHSFPFHVNLEGNASYRSDCFYRVGGWDDRIHYGYGGLELFLRLRRFETNGYRQI